MEPSKDLWSHRLLLDSEKKQALTVGRERQLFRWNVEADPEVLECQQLDYWFDIRPMDEERFIVLNKSSYELEIWSWKDWSILECYGTDTAECDQLEDAVYLPKHQMILVGGGWNPLYFLNLKDGSFRKAHKNAKYMGYVTYLQVNEDETLVTHTDNDQFNAVGLYKIDWENLKIEFIQRIGGDLRCHRDIVRFEGNQLVHVWMDMYAMQQVYCWKYEEAELKLLWKHSVPMIMHEHTASDPWRSALCWGIRSVFVGAGQMLLQINGGDGSLAGRLRRFYVFDELIHDMALYKPYPAELLIATDRGLIKYHSEKDSVREKRWKLME